MAYLPTFQAHQAAPQRRTHRLVRWAPTTLMALLLAACGGGGDAASTDATVASSGTNQSALAVAKKKVVAPQAVAPTTRPEAFRLLNQASFGATDAELNRVTALGATGWIDEQLAKPAKAAHLARWQADDAAIKAANPTATAGPSEVISSFYNQALFADDQLRQRVVYALSQIFVVSTIALNSGQGQMVASYEDMLGRNAFGNFRTLLQDVAMHPAMGNYLSHLKNRREAPLLGRVPDQNFAREVMQLFTIGLQTLNLDGTPKLGQDGAPMETYLPADIEGLAAVFTGYSWYGPDTDSKRFYALQGYQDPNRMNRPMQAYATFHSMSEKRFLGTVVPAQALPDAAASTQAAYDTLFNHPNVGPFIGKQLIKRLVTSNPSPAYVARVAAAFNNNGAGVRGDMKAVIRAILVDDEARSTTVAQGERYGKLREPVLRVTAFLRAFNAKSDSGKVKMLTTDDAGLQLGQSPLRAPSVFNFYRPGFVPSGEAGAAGLTVPEMQTTDETSIAGYANYMQVAVDKGVGARYANPARPDMQPNYATEFALATQPAALVDQVVSRLLGDGVSTAFKAEVTAAVESVVIPAPNKQGTNTGKIDNAKRNRVLVATLLCLVSPEFIVQK